MEWRGKLTTTNVVVGIRFEIDHSFRELRTRRRVHCMHAGGHALLWIGWLLAAPHLPIPDNGQETTYSAFIDIAGYKR